MYWKKGNSLYKIAKTYKVAHTTVCSLMKKHGIPRRPNPARKLFVSRGKLKNLYWEEKKTLREIALIHGVSPSIVCDLMKKYNIPRRFKDRKVFVKKGELENLYLRQQKPMHEIAQKLGVNTTTILNWMQRYNIPRRHVGTGHTKHIPETGLNIEKAYVLGVLTSDGYIESYRLGLDATDRDFVEYFAYCIEKIFKTPVRIKYRMSRSANWKPQFVVRLNSKEACRELLHFGKFKQENWGVPKEIFASDEKIICSYLQGFADGDGGVDKTNGFIGLYSKNLLGLKEIGLLLSKIGISWRLVARIDKASTIKIHKLSDLITYQKKIGFSIGRKNQCLSKIISKKGYHAN